MDVRPRDRRGEFSDEVDAAGHLRVRRESLRLHTIERERLTGHMSETDRVPDLTTAFTATA